MWQAVRNWVRQAIYLFPLTPFGLGAGALSAGALYYYGKKELDLVVYIFAVGTLLLVGLSLIFTLIGTMRTYLLLRAERARLRPSDPRKIVALVAQQSGFHLPALLWLPFVRVQSDFVGHANSNKVVSSWRRRGFHNHETLNFLERDHLTKAQRLITCGDVFGFTRMRFFFASPGALIVYPHLGNVKKVDALRSLATGDAYPHPMGVDQGDRVEIRRYQPGDPARFIHWNVYARNRKLVVRHPERALSESDRTAIYFVTGVRDEASAAILSYCLRNDAFGNEWLFGCDGFPEPTHNTDEAIERIPRTRASTSDLLRSELHGGAQALTHFLNTVDKTGPAALVLFLPAGLHNNREAFECVRVAIAKRRQGRVLCVIGSDGIEAQKISTWRRLLFTGSQNPHSDTITLTTTLEEMGVQVCVIDRPSGRIFLSAAALAEVTAPKKGAQKRHLGTSTTEKARRAA